MGHYVHIHVCFNADSNEGIAKLARRHRELLGDDYPEDCPEVIWYLEDLTRRTGENSGPKGGLSLWGMVGNHTDAEQFVEVLRPFWADLLGRGIEGGPPSHNRILVFYEEEQSKAANAFEIGWDDQNSPERQIVINHYRRLPFAWNQY